MNPTISHGTGISWGPCDPHWDPNPLLWKSSNSGNVRIKPPFSKQPPFPRWDKCREGQCQTTSAGSVDKSHFLPSLYPRSPWLWERHSSALISNNFNQAFNNILIPDVLSGWLTASTQMALIYIQTLRNRWQAWKIRFGNSTSRAEL